MSVFARRVLLHFAAALAVLSVSLALGMAGYEYFENLPWRDAFLNAAMLMGPEATCVGRVSACTFFVGLLSVDTSQRETWPCEPAALPVAGARGSLSGPRCARAFVNRSPA